jgi:hypothetical protein
MKCGRRIAVLVALALVELSSIESRAKPQKTAAAAPVKAADLELLVEVAGARTLPAGLDESSPKLAKIVSLVEAGKLQTALPLIAKYAKANKAHLDEATSAKLASWIVRRALLVPNKDVYVAADRLRFAREGKLAIAKYEAGLSGKAPTELAPAFVLTQYTDGAVAVTVVAKQKQVSDIRKDLATAKKNLASAVKTAASELQAFVSTEKDGAWTTLPKSIADSKGEVQKALARFG